MKFYQELTLLPNVEVGLNFLWKKMFQQVHLALVSVKGSDNMVSVGISFPGYSVEKGELGEKLRLFASTEQELEALDIKKWLIRFSDYVHITGIRAVPAALIKSHACFKRWRKDLNPERLARRRAKRHNETTEKALEHFSSFKTPELKLPFIDVKSLSGNNEFKLVIEMKQNPAVQGRFTCYGLSPSATVPVF